MTENAGERECVAAGWSGCVRRGCCSAVEPCEADKSWLHCVCVRERRDRGWSGRPAGRRTGCASTRFNDKA
ncbi:hypothetical protein SRHO_G00338240 [Serrasalmus rhombeus]